VILERCDTLRSRIETKKRVERSAKEIARFKKVRDILSQHSLSLVSLVTVSDILAEAGISVRPLPSGSDTALTAVRTLKESFAERPDMVVDDQFKPVRLDRTLRAAVETLDSHLLGCWRRHALQLIPPTNESVLEVLSAAFTTEVRRIRSESAKLTLSADCLPRTLEDIRTFEQNAANVHAIWGQLGGGNVPQAVLSFLKSAASHGGAGLDLLTTEVRGWLAAHDITNSFSVRVATSPR